MRDTVGCSGAAEDTETSTVNPGTKTPPLVGTRPHTPTQVQDSGDIGDMHNIYPTSLLRIFW